MKKSPRLLLAGLLSIGLAPTAALAVEVYPVFADPNGLADVDNPQPGEINLFNDDPPYALDTNAAFRNNDLAVYTLAGPSGNNGAGFSVFISNGENGIDQTLDGTDNTDINDDVPNPFGVNPAVAAVNGGGKLQNGNVFRMSAWMRQDPNNPITVAPQIQPVFKFELWKEAFSGNADFNPGEFPTFGDRVWDTDQNGGQGGNPAAGQSQADWVDINNSGTTSFGLPVSQSLVTDEWRQVVTEIVIDDDPLNDGFGWGIGDDLYTVDDIEEIRAVMFFGDFAGTDLTDGGSVWLDNVLVEVFADQSALDAAPSALVANPAPVETDTVFGDFEPDGDVDIIDFGLFADAFDSVTGDANYNELADAEPDGDVDIIDFGLFADNFGIGVEASAVPEPVAAVMALAALVAVPARRR